MSPNVGRLKVVVAIGLTLSISLGNNLATALFVEESWTVAWAHLFSCDGPLPESHLFITKPADIAPAGSAHPFFTPREPHPLGELTEAETTTYQQSSRCLRSVGTSDVLLANHRSTCRQAPSCVPRHCLWSLDSHLQIVCLLGSQPNSPLSKASDPWPRLQMRQTRSEWKQAPKTARIAGLRLRLHPVVSPPLP